MSQFISFIKKYRKIFWDKFFKNNDLNHKNNEIKEYLENIIDLMPWHVYWKDRNSVYMGCNDLQAKDAGLLNREEIVGKTDYDMPWKEQADILRKIDSEVMKTGVSQIAEEPSTLANGKDAIFLSKKVPHFYNGKIIGIVGISIDITEKKQIEQELLQTRQMLEKVLNTIPGHVFWKDRNCILLGCNDLQAIHMGFSTNKDLIGKSNYDVIWPNQPEELRKAQADAITKVDLKVMETGETYTAEEPLVMPDGSTAIYLSKKTPMRNENDEIIGLLGVSIDITEKKQMEQELVRAQQMLENVINNIPGHVYWKNRNGVLLGCNDEQAKDIGLKSKEEIVGMTAYDTLSKELADEVTRSDSEIINSGIPKTIEETLVLPTGEKSFWLSRKVPLRDDKNTIIGILGISVDITEIKKTRKKLLETKHKLEGMTTVSSSIAHELRTPLATMGMKTTNLDKYVPQLLNTYHLAQQAKLNIPKITPEQIVWLKSFSKSMEFEIRSAFTFIDMLLMNLETQVSAKDEEFFLISDCIQETFARYPFQPGQKELVHIKLENDFEVKAQRILVTHVFFNLIKNALYYIAAAGKGEIFISLESDKNYNKVLFKDTGTGISKDVLPNIFKRFYSKTYHGAGIGLTYCKLVMKSLGGNITCESEERHYTVFTLLFPKL